MSTVIAKLIPGTRSLNDSFFDGKEDKLDKAVPQFSDNPYKGHDNSPWSAEIGSDGFLGVYKTQKGRKADYYMVAKTASKRNSQRAIYAAARSLGLDVKGTEDFSAYVSQPYIAKPTIAECHPICGQGKTAIYEGPYNGISIFDVVGQDIPTQTEKNKTPGYGNYNESGFVWEGKSKTHPDLRQDLFREVDLNEMKKLGWKQGEHTHMIPVLVKLGNPDLNK